MKTHLNVLLLMEEILHQLIDSLSHHLQGFIHPRWCKTSINCSYNFLHGLLQKSTFRGGTRRMLVDTFFDVCHLHVGIKLFLACGGASNASTHSDTPIREFQRELRIGGLRAWKNRLTTGSSLVMVDLFRSC